MTNARRNFQIDLAPLVGSRFQPTGFPDIGAARFERFDASAKQGSGGFVDALLVESAQSMANRLEATGLDANRRPTGPLAELPWVEVVDDAGEFVTSSRAEAHRLAGAYLRHASLGDRTLADVLCERFDLQEAKPMDHHRVVREVFSLDPLSVLHGVFFAIKSWPFQPKITRAITCFVEALDVRRADSGGVKTDDVLHALGGTKLSADSGYGMVPHHREEWTARAVKLSASLDRHILATSGLSAAAVELLETIAAYELAVTLRSGLRFRTACDLQIIDDRHEPMDASRVVDADGEPLGEPDDLATKIRELSTTCPELDVSERPTTVIWSVERGRTASKSE